MALFCLDFSALCSVEPIRFSVLYLVYKFIIMFFVKNVSIKMNIILTFIIHLLAAIMEVVLSQTCGKIFVGDPHQQIYTFRGAVNALCEVPHTHIFYLTQVSLYLP